MTEKTFTQEEINELTNNVFNIYHTIFQADKMSFHDWILVKGVIMEIQGLLDDKVIEND